MVKKDAAKTGGSEKKVKKDRIVKKEKKEKKIKMDKEELEVDAPEAPQPSWLFGPVYHKHGDVDANQEKERKQALEYVKEQMGRPKARSHVNGAVLYLVRRFLSSMGMQFTERMLDLESDVRGALLGTDGLAGFQELEEEITLEKVYEEWRLDVESTDSASVNDSDASMAGVGANKASMSSASSTTSSDNNADDENEDKEATPMPKAAAMRSTSPILANKLKRKASSSSSSASPSAAETDSESGSSSESDSDSSSGVSEPLSKKAKLTALKSAASVPLPPPTDEESFAGTSDDDSVSLDSDSPSDSDSSASPPPKTAPAKIAAQKGRTMSEDSSETVLATSPILKLAPMKAYSETSSSSSSSSTSSRESTPSPTISQPKNAFPPPTTAKASSESHKRKRSLSPHSARALVSSGTSSSTNGTKPTTSNKAAKASATAKRFSRIPSDIKFNEKLASNAYVPYDYAQKAHEDLIVTRGKGFTKAKNKKKRGSYKGGTIDVGGGKGIKFED